MEEQRISIGKYAFGAGLLTGAVLSLISLGEKIPSITGVVWAIRLIVLVMITMYFVRSYRSKYCGGFISGGKIFSLTFQIFLYIGLVAAVYTFITMLVMPSGEYQIVIESMRENYSKAGVDISGVDFENVIKLIPYCAAFIIFLGHIIIGLIFGAVYSSSFKRENTTPTPLQ